MTGEKGGLLAGLRAEALKSRHAAPVRLAVLMALPMPLLGAMPYRGVQIFSAWNYWYALFLPVSLSLVVACVARADARTRMRGLLGLGFPLGRAWWAKALWCLALCTLSNLVVFGIYLAGSAFSSQGLTAAGTLTMLLCALANTVTAAWMIPAGLFLTARLGMLAGIFCPLATQLVGGFAWSLMPLPQLFPPSASMVIPTSFIPVLPSGEPLAADMALGGALAADGMLTLAGLAVCAIAFGLATLMWTVPGGAQETGGPYMRDPRHPRHFTDEFKRQIVDLYNAGKPKREIMDEYDLGKSTVERWIKSINATGSPRAACNRTPEQNRILELERENRRLRMEVDVLKQAAPIYARK